MANFGWHHSKCKDTKRHDRDHDDKDCRPVSWHHKHDHGGHHHYDKKHHHCG